MTIPINSEICNPETVEEAKSSTSFQDQGISQQVSDDDLVVGNPSGLETPDVTDEDIEELLIPQDFSSQLVVLTDTSNVELRKTDGMEFHRTHAEWAPERAFLVKGRMGKFFVLHPKLYNKYSREAKAYLLVPTITLLGLVFLWPIRIAGAGDVLDVWNKKALQAAELGRSRWFRIIANKLLTGYDVEFPEDSLDDPVWPKDITSMRQLLKLAFRDIVIKDEDHPVLQKLRGKNL